MSDQKETEGQARARQAGERAQSNAESGASGSMINSEPWSGGGSDGSACTMTDGRAGVIRRTATGLVCVVEDEEDKDSRDSKTEKDED